MSTKNKEKLTLHPRNRNRERYDLSAMSSSMPELSTFISKNTVGLETINFSDPEAVRALNTAILNHYYGIKYWDFPKHNLCPPIPGRAEYIHRIGDLLSEANKGEVPKGEKVKCLDIGIGASCIYPIIGITEYDWNFIGSDVNAKSIESAENIISSNPSLEGKIKCELQNDPHSIFQGIIKISDRIDITICNPPFHSSAEEALKGNRRKNTNLNGKNAGNSKLNFSGIKKELIYEGGETKFISQMIKESKDFAKRCLWFSTIVSKESKLERIYKKLENIRPKDVRTIDIKTGNKMSRIVAWTFFTVEERKAWFEAK